MLSTPHIAVGVAIATQVNNPLLAVPLAFASHFILDMIPHWNPHLNTEMREHGHITKRTKAIIFGDTAIGAVLMGWTAFAAPNSMQTVNILSTSIAAILPDIIEAPYFFFHIKTPLLMKWLAFQKSIQTDANFTFGVATQIVVILTAFWTYLVS